MKSDWQQMMVALSLLFPVALFAQVPEVTGTCVSGCSGGSTPNWHEPSAAEQRRQDQYNAAIDRYNRGMRIARDLYERGRKASNHRHDLEALDLFRRAYAALLNVDTSNYGSLSDSKQRQIFTYQQAIAFSEFNYALGLRNSHDWNAAIGYFQQALNDYPIAGSDRGKLQAAIENTKRMQASQIQQEQEAERQQIAELQWKAEEARMQNLLGAGRLYDQQLSTPSVDINKPVDPGFFVSADLYQSANRKMGELRNLESKLSTKITELDHWRGDMLAQKREFDQLHAEAAHGELGEVIAVIPADAVFTHMLEKGMITAESAQELKETFERLKKSGEVLAVVAEAKDERDLVKAQIKATDGIIEELIKVGKDLPIDSPEREWDLNTVKALKMFAEAANAMLGESTDTAKWWERTEPAADLVASLSGIAIPPFGVALKLERIADREWRKKIVSRAQNSLGGAVADNWNARGYLSQKLDRVRSDMAETQRTISTYEARRRQND